MAKKKAGAGPGTRSRKGPGKKAKRPKAKARTEEEPELEPAPSQGMMPDGAQWTSPVCFDAKSLSQVLRDCLDELDFSYKRTQSDKLYNQVMVLFPIPKSAYIFRFQVTRPIKLWIDFYDTKPSHAGIIPYMDIQGITPKKLKHLKRLFDVMIEKLPRPPWKFAMIQKLQHGLLIPEWHWAKKAWRRLGYRI